MSESSFGEGGGPKTGFDPSQPLSDRERQQITRLFSEPMEFPLEFRNWVKNYVENVITLPRSSIVGLKTTTTLMDMQAGLIFLVPEGEPPPGTVAASGGRVASADHPLLHQALGAPSEEMLSLPTLPAPEGTMYVITTGERRPAPVPES